MKYFYYLLIFFVTSIATAKAQWSFGLQGGAHSGNYHFSNQATEAEITNLTGLMLGGISIYDLNEQSFLLSGLRYTRKGGHVIFNSYSSRLDNKVYYEFLEMPLYFNYILFKWDILQPYVYAGADVGYLLAVKFNGTINDKPIEGDMISDWDKRMDLTLAFGFGFRSPEENNFSYLLNANYSFGGIVLEHYSDITITGIQVLFGIIYSL